MSASPGRPAINPNETKEQKAQRVFSSSVARVLLAFEKLGNLGPVLAEFDAATREAAVRQINDVIAQKHASSMKALLEAKRPKPVFSLIIPQEKP